MDIVERTGSGLYDVELKARLGDLSGLADTDLVHNRSNPGFGLATDNVYLQGGIIATFGEIGGFGINENTISSSNDNLILRDNGQITGSNVLFDGGTLGGFEVGESIISSSNSQLILKSNGNITASAALISGSGIQVDTPNFTIDSDGDVSAENMVLSNAVRADGVSYTFVTLNTTNLGDYFGIYSGSDGNLYTVLDLSGDNSIINTGSSGAAYVRINNAPKYPIGCIIPPFYYRGPTTSVNNGVVSQIIIETATSDVPFAVDAKGKFIPPHAKTVFAYGDETTVLLEHQVTNWITERSIIDENASKVFYEDSIQSSYTYNGYTYSNKVFLAGLGQQFLMGKGTFAWKILGASQYDNFLVRGNVRAEQINVAPQYLHFGYNSNVTSTTHVEMLTVNGVNNGQGYRMPTAGKVTTLSAQFDCGVTYNGNAYFVIYKNGSVVYGVQLDVTNGGATGDFGGILGDNSTSLVNYSAGDRLSVYVSVNNSSMNIDDIAVILRVVENIPQ